MNNSESIGNDPGGTEIITRTVSALTDFTLIRISINPEALGILRILMEDD